MSNALAADRPGSPLAVWLQNELVLSVLELLAVVALALAIGVIVGAAAFKAGYDVTAASPPPRLRGPL